MTVVHVAGQLHVVLEVDLLPYQAAWFSAVAGDLTDPVKVFTKIALAKQGDNTDKDVNALADKIACGDTVNKIVEDLTPDKTSALSAIMRATKPINGVKSKGDDMLLYVDMATLLAMNGGELGKQIIDDTLAPALGNTKKWTLTQKAKAARLGLKLKRFVKKMEQQSVAAAEDAGNAVGETKDGIVKRIDTGKEVVAQTQAELDQKLEEANQQYNEMTTMINDIIAEEGVMEGEATDMAAEGIVELVREFLDSVGYRHLIDKY